MRLLAVVTIAACLLAVILILASVVGMGLVQDGAPKWIGSIATIVVAAALTPAGLAVFITLLNKLSK